ncbi:hypothetical protein IT575_11665 [bacterium]|nr:hypothetical protein [bacterium]
MDDDKLASLEPQFGSDPRFWELLCWSLQISTADWPGGNYLRPSDDREVLLQCAGFLERARSSGKASPEALLRLAEIRHQLRSAEIDGLVDAPSLLTAMAEDEDKHLADLIDIRRQWPDEAAPHFWLAEYYLQYGENELALAELTACANAPVCGCPGLFPERFIRERLNLREPCGDRALAGAILFTSTSTQTQDAIRLQSRIKEISSTLALGGDPDLATWAVRACCRMAMADGADFWHLNAALNSSRSLTRYSLENLSAGLSQEQLASLTRCYSFALSQISRNKQATASALPALELLPGLSMQLNVIGPVETIRLPKGEELAAWQLADADESPEPQLMDPRGPLSIYCDYVEVQIEPVRVDYASVLRRLQDFDFAAVSWPLDEPDF